MGAVCRDWGTLGHNGTFGSSELSMGEPLVTVGVLVAG
jgi:hypothetical protein